MRKLDDLLVVVTTILDFRMLLYLRHDVLHFLVFDEPSANWTLFVLWKVVIDDHAVLVLLGNSLHKPISVNTNKMESVEAVPNPDEISSVGEALQRFFLLHFFLFGQT